MGVVSSSTAPLSFCLCLAAFRQRVLLVVSRKRDDEQKTFSLAWQDSLVYVLYSVYRQQQCWLHREVTSCLLHEADNVLTVVCLWTQVSYVRRGFRCLRAEILLYLGPSSRWCYCTVCVRSNFASNLKMNAVKFQSRPGRRKILQAGVEGGEIRQCRSRLFFIFPLFRLKKTVRPDELPVQIYKYFLLQTTSPPPRRGYLSQIFARLQGHRKMDTTSSPLRLQRREW